MAQLHREVSACGWVDENRASAMGKPPPTPSTDNSPPKANQPPQLSLASSSASTAMSYLQPPHPTPPNCLSLLGHSVPRPLHTSHRGLACWLAAPRAVWAPISHGRSLTQHLVRETGNAQVLLTWEAETCRVASGDGLLGCTWHLYSTERWSHLGPGTQPPLPRL